MQPYALNYLLELGGSTQSGSGYPARGHFVQDSLKACLRYIVKISVKSIPERERENFRVILHNIVIRFCGKGDVSQCPRNAIVSPIWPTSEDRNHSPGGAFA